jgi:hypothetical protein
MGLPDFPRSYSLANLVLFFGGLIPGGFGEGDAFTIEPVSPSWLATEGVDGSVAFSDTGSRLYMVKINLLQTSPMNSAMSAIYNVQALTKLALPVAFKDTLGADKFKADAGVIQQMPNVARGSKASSQEWPILAAGCDLFLGGN